MTRTEIIILLKDQVDNLTPEEKPVIGLLEKKPFTFALAKRAETIITRLQKVFNE